MNIRPYMLLAAGATLDALVAWVLLRVGFAGMAAFMAVVAVAGFVLALVLWRRTR